MYLQLLTSSQQSQSPVDHGTGDFKSGVAVSLGRFGWFVTLIGNPVVVKGWSIFEESFGGCG
jgi:hypothetical protein